MKLPMIAALSVAAGSITAIAVTAASNLIAHHNQRDAHMQDIMYAQLLQQTKQELNGTAPQGSLPLDASTEPGFPPLPGSARPEIMYKPGFKPPGYSSTPSAQLVLRRTDKLVPKTNDPIWVLELVTKDGQVLESLPALTGRASKQTANRNIAGNKSPLPTGTYSIDRGGIATAPFEDPELGRGYWVPITPLFNTNRSALGLHQDPSWGKTNGESGTSGCIGLESADATVKLVTWIKHFNIQKLTVKS